MSISRERVRELLQEDSAKAPLASTGYDCPVCGRPSVKIIPGGYISILQCTACGWSMSSAKWNTLTNEQKKALRKKKTIKSKIKDKLTGK